MKRRTKPADSNNTLDSNTKAPKQTLTVALGVLCCGGQFFVSLGHQKKLASPNSASCSHKHLILTAQNTTAPHPIDPLLANPDLHKHKIHEQTNELICSLFKNHCLPIIRAVIQNSQKCQWRNRMGKIHFSGLS